MNYSDDKSLERLSELASILRGSDLRGISEARLDEILESVLQGYFFQVSTYDHRQLCYRARKCQNKAGFDNLADCLNPPRGSAEFGRASLPFELVIYSSWNIPTALDEISAMPGEFVQVTAFNAVPGVQTKMAKIGDLQRRANSGRTLFPDLPDDSKFQQWRASNPSTYQRALYIDCLLAEIFTSASTRHVEYRISAKFAATTYTRGFGLIYPSVRSPHAMNIAHHRSMFDGGCQVLFTQVLEIEEFLGYSIYGFNRLKFSSVFRPDGGIEWGSVNLPMPNKGAFGAPEPLDNLYGWRPPPAANPSTKSSDE